MELILKLQTSLLISFLQFQQKKEAKKSKQNCDYLLNAISVKHVPFRTVNSTVSQQKINKDRKKETLKRLCSNVIYYFPTFGCRVYALLGQTCRPMLKQCTRLHYLALVPFSFWLLDNFVLE